MWYRAGVYSLRKERFYEKVGQRIETRVPYDHQSALGPTTNISIMNIRNSRVDGPAHPWLHVMEASGVTAFLRFIRCNVSPLFYWIVLEMVRRFIKYIGAHYKNQFQCFVSISPKNTARFAMRAHWSNPVNTVSRVASNTVKPQIGETFGARRGESEWI